MEQSTSYWVYEGLPLPVQLTVILDVPILPMEEICGTAARVYVETGAVQEEYTEFNAPAVTV
ncbi:MAG: hypothetical protein BWY26_00483 [Elusimicrobia bacterium ADurb.Bin231]|nr:MAG: hypothetical protein BWY26_00483 [Elusimicrobia bacterium ADurb.Bin231]